MAEKDRLSESIKYRVEWIRLLWLTVIAVSGGVISLLLGDLQTLQHRWAVIAGIGVLIAIGVLLARLDKQIRSAIEKLKEE